MGSGDVALQDTQTDVEAASESAKDAASYGALDIKETTDEDAEDTPKQQDSDWHKDKPASQKEEEIQEKECTSQREYSRNSRQSSSSVMLPSCVHFH